jgi:hypothetical protein
VLPEVVVVALAVTAVEVVLRGSTIELGLVELTWTLDLTPPVTLILGLTVIAWTDWAIVIAKARPDT